ncbi:peptidase S8/S53 domain-containing protein [Phycomyces nitens]|nr:peptidase S8/S53 domain-containing protein [Phycomyces nitens]
MKITISIQQIFYLLLLSLLHRGDKVRALENATKSDSGITPLSESSLPSSRRFTVQFHSPPGNTQAATADQDRFLDHLTANNIQFRVRYRYTNVINALSIDLAPKSLMSRSITDHRSTINHSQSLEFLASHPSIRKHWPGKRYSRPATHNTRSNVFGNISVEEIANLPAAHLLTGVSRVRAENVSGKGIKIGILDTGIDYTHPALGGCFGPGCKVAYGYDLVGDTYGKDGKILADNDPLDTCDGHGTHVAVAANDTLKEFQGVAPNVELGVWRIFGCEGETDDDIILQAAVSYTSYLFYQLDDCLENLLKLSVHAHTKELAYNAGMDIINLSLGGSQNAWEEEALAVALSNLAERGVVVIVAQGNDGKDGISRTPSPSIGRRVLTVASVDNVQRQTRMLHVVFDNQEHSFEYEIADNGKSDFENKTYGLVAARASLDPNTGLQTVAQTAEYGCKPFDPSRFLGSVVLVRRGKCEFSKKAINVQEAGGVGILVYNRRGEEATTIDLGNSNVTIPVGSIDGHNGATLFSMFSRTIDPNTSLKTTFSNKMAPIQTGELSSIFSSWGPDAELHFKPEISAVGGYVFSTFPVSMGGYKTMSGTSMATPYLAGCIALYMEATKHRDPATVYRSFVNTAKPILGKHNHTLESPVKQGAGLVQVYDAINTKSSIEPFKLALNDTEYFKGFNTITITNESNRPRLYHISHSMATSVSGYNFTKSAVPLRRPHYIDIGADVAINQTTFVLGFNQSIVVNLAFTPPKWTNLIDNPHLLYGGYIRVQSTSNDTAPEVLHVPYFGSLGRQRDLPIFDVKKGYPFIGNYLGRRLSGPIDQTSVPTTDSTSNTTQQILKYDFSRANSVHLYLRLGNPTAMLKGELLNAHNVSVGEIPDVHQEWLPRNDHSDTNRERSIHWRGSITTSSVNTSAQIIHVPQGIYRIKLSALKIFGNPLEDKDWEVWTSPELALSGY